MFFSNIVSFVNNTSSRFQSRYIGNRILQGCIVYYLFVVSTRWRFITTGAAAAGEKGLNFGVDRRARPNTLVVNSSENEVMSPK